MEKESSADTPPNNVVKALQQLIMKKKTLVFLQKFITHMFNVYGKLSSNLVRNRELIAQFNELRNENSALRVLADAASKLSSSSAPMK